MSSAVRVRFGLFEADLATGELFNNGHRLPLQEKPFQILALLIQKPGHLVTRQEVYSRVWPDVCEPNSHSLNSAIRRLRAVLEKADPLSQHIETIGGRGYRFRTGIEASVGIAALDDIDCESQPRLAVFPFTNLVDGSQDYFSDGLTEQMIVQLGRLRKNVSVISPVSSLYLRNVTKELIKTAQSLRVDYVLSGTVWRIPPRLRITAKLVRVVDQRCFWSESYAGSDADIFQLQDEITRNISRSLFDQLPLPCLPEACLTTSPAIYETYLKARFFSNKCADSSFAKSLQLFESVIHDDPMFAPAHSDLAMMLTAAVTYGGAPPQVVYERIREHASNALALCEEMAEAHTALAFARLWAAEWVPAEDSFRRALGINPSLSMAHVGFAYLLGTLGRREEAVIEAERARELDPLSPVINTMLGMVLFQTGHLQEALECQRNCIEIEPTFCAAHAMLSLIYEVKGDLVQSVGASRAAVQHAPDSPLMLCHLGRSLGIAGETHEATRILQELLQLRATCYISATWIALIYAALGQEENSINWLCTAASECDPWRLCLAADPRFDALRNDDRFLSILRKIGLPSLR